MDFVRCQMRINQGKGKKDRMVPFPESFKELLALHCDNMKHKNAVYLFESSWDKKYTDRGIRKILAKYSEVRGCEASELPKLMVDSTDLYLIKNSGIKLTEQVECDSIGLT
ncbi:hypothetical protein VQL36_11370 [Chengkuizengella sp. SCS-71B]|uniref:hypothetical protein n=1 Tax=Chengkuizengella sp. SCS-71B TaxID=3115290 RepID=UPI0032C20D96